MSPQPDLPGILDQSKRRGYFATEDFPGLTLTPPELRELMRLLEKHKIPFGRPETTIASIPDLTSKAARRIVDAVRRGTPAFEHTNYYSAGREKLLDQVTHDLETVAGGQSLVRFLNADIGQGKTHVLYLLRELAFRHDFVVSLVMLSQNSCPLYDFMAVYYETMWGLRTHDQRQRPALSNIFDRWLEGIRRLSPARVRQIVENELPVNLRTIMAAYVDVTNMFRPDEEKRLAILRYLGGEKTLVRSLHQMNLPLRIDSTNALHILSEMATTIRHIGFKGICILFDEAEAIHSFATSSQRDQAFENLQQIIQQSRSFPHCYFIYATTPSFFEGGGSGWISQQLGKDSIIELEPLTASDRWSVGDKISNIYSVATGWTAPASVMKAVQKAAEAAKQARVGDYVRQVVAILDEAKLQA